MATKQRTKSPTKGIADGASPTKGMASGASPTKGIADGASPTKGMTSGASPTKGMTSGASPTKGMVSGGNVDRKAESPLKKLNQIMSPSPRDISKAPDAGDFIKCDLCRQKLDDPRSLDCMHSYCRDCLMTYIMETVEEDTRHTERSIVCPVCLQKTSPPHGVDDPANWADSIQPFDFLVSYLEAKNLRDPHKKCDTCTRQHKRREAEKWCNTCHDALCDECVAFHNALKTTKGHSLTLLSKLRNQPIEKTLPVSHCLEHKGETVSNFCEQHSKIVCKKCVAESHKSCKNVVSLVQAATKRSGEISKTNDILGEQSKLAHAVHENRVGEDKHIDESQYAALEKIEDVRKKINENLSKCEQQIMGELHEIHAQTKQGLQKEMKQAQRLRKSSAKVHGLATNTSKYGTDDHKLQIGQHTPQQVDHYNHKLSSLNGSIKHTQIEFVVDSTLERLMSGISKLGDVRVTKTRAAMPPPTMLNLERSNSDPEDELDFYRSRRSGANSPGSKSDRKSRKSVKFEPTGSTTSSLIGTVSCNTTTDTETCWFTGIAYLPDGRIVLVDRNNKKMKIVKDMNMETEVPLDNQPWGIAMMGSHEVALTFPRQNRIAIFSMVSTPTLSSDIQTSDRCYGVAYASDRFAITCACASPPCIKILTRDGRETHSLSPSDNLHPMFLRPWYIQIDAAGTNLFISDCNRCHVICITGKTIKRYKYEDSSMNSPRGLHVLTDGRVIVCGFGTDNVQLLDQDGRLKNTILSRNDDITGPQDVTLNPREDAMAVTFDPSSGCSEVLKLYKISI